MEITTRDSLIRYSLGITVHYLLSSVGEGIKLFLAMEGDGVTTTFL